jgi:hypothetical protein
MIRGERGQPAAVLRKRQLGYAGPASGLAERLNEYVRAGCSRLVQTSDI